MVYFKDKGERVMQGGWVVCLSLFAGGWGRTTVSSEKVHIDRVWAESQLYASGY